MFLFRYHFFSRVVGVDAHISRRPDFSFRCVWKMGLDTSEVGCGTLIILTYTKYTYSLTHTTRIAKTTKNSRIHFKKEKKKRRTLTLNLNYDYSSLNFYPAIIIFRMRRLLLYQMKFLYILNIDMCRTLVFDRNV